MTLYDRNLLSYNVVQDNIIFVTYLYEYMQVVTFYSMFILHDDQLITYYQMIVLSNHYPTGDSHTVANIKKSKEFNK